MFFEGWDRLLSLQEGEGVEMNWRRGITEWMITGFFYRRKEREGGGVWRGGMYEGKMLLEMVFLEEYQIIGGAGCITIGRQKQRGGVRG